MAAASAAAMLPPVRSASAAVDPDRVQVVGQMHVYRAAYEDTLAELGRRFGLGYVETRAANPGVDPWLPGAGTEIVLPTAHLLPDAPQDGILINITEMRLYYFAEPNTEPQTFPIGIGREGRSTPIGRTRVERKTKDPTWRPTASVRAEKPYLPAVVPPGPDNPLGQYALYLGWPAYLIHGTNTPYGVGRRLSAGCIRMYPEDIERLYPQISVGTRVTTVEQDVKLGWIGGELYLEVSPTIEMANPIEFGEAYDQVLPENLMDRVLDAAGDQSARLDQAVIMQAGLERRGYPVRVTR